MEVESDDDGCDLFHDFASTHTEHDVCCGFVPSRHDATVCDGCENHESLHSRQRGIESKALSFLSNALRETPIPTQSDKSLQTRLTSANAIGNCTFADFFAILNADSKGNLSPRNHPTQEVVRESFERAERSKTTRKLVIPYEYSNDQYDFDAKQKGLVYKSQAMEFLIQIHVTTILCHILGDERNTRQRIVADYFPSPLRLKNNVLFYSKLYRRENVHVSAFGRDFTVIQFRILDHCCFPDEVKSCQVLQKSDGRMSDAESTRYPIPYKCQFGVEVEMDAHKHHFAGLAQIVRTGYEAFLHPKYELFVGIVTDIKFWYFFVILPPQNHAQHRRYGNEPTTDDYECPTVLQTPKVQYNDPMLARCLSVLSKRELPAACLQEKNDISYLVTGICKSNFQPYQFQKTNTKRKLDEQPYPQSKRAK
jgi:hypothetical protein